MNNAASREQLHLRARDAVEDQQYAQLFLIVSTLYPGSIVAQALAIFFHADGRNIIPEIRTQVLQWTPATLEKLTHLHDTLGINLMVSLKLIDNLLIEAEEIITILFNKPQVNITLARLEAEWATHEDNKQKTEENKGVHDVNLLYAFLLDD